MEGLITFSQELNLEPFKVPTKEGLLQYKDYLGDKTKTPLNPRH
jgi:hypothetical protein